MGLCFANKYRVIAICFAFAIAATYAAAYALRTPKQTKITVVATYMADSDLMDTLEMEESIGEGKVATFLRTNGYEVEHVLSFHDLVKPETLGGNGPLKNYFSEHEPETNEARVLFVTVVAMVHEGEVASGVILMDADVTEISHKYSGPPITNIGWNYVAPDSSLPPREAAANLEVQLDRGLKAYDRHRRQGSIQ